MFKLRIMGWTLRWCSMWGSRGMKAERDRGGLEIARNQNTLCSGSDQAFGVD